MQKKVRPVVDAAACTACIPAAVPAMKPSWRAASAAMKPSWRAVSAAMKPSRRAVSAASPVFVSLSVFVEERGQWSNKRTV